MKNISFILGTRPEAIKLAPVILSMKRDPFFKVDVCVTAQHREMLDQTLSIFGIKPDTDLNLMSESQTLAGLTSLAVSEIDKYLGNEKPHLIIVQGDTTTVLTAALSAFYHKIPIAHVEAGLRTWQKYSPFPEEMNRVLTSRLCDIHFAPTELSKNNLMNEGISEKKIFVTGNTVIDTLLFVSNKIAEQKFVIDGLENFDWNKKFILVTGHRRENFGKNFQNICLSIKQIALNNPDVNIIYPVHLNPNVQKPVYEILDGIKNIYLIKPLNYEKFIWIMSKAHIILTDSGGIQEEAPTLGKPVLVTRESTERPEGIAAGTIRLVGSSADKISEGINTLLKDDSIYKKMSEAKNPYGDGTASLKIINILKNYFEKPLV